MNTINELYIVSGPKAAERFAAERGFNTVAEKIRFGQFRPQTKKFDSARARARSEAMAWLRKQPKAA